MKIRNAVRLGLLAVIACSTPFRASGQSVDSVPTIAVQGVGSVELDPDFVEIVLGVETQAPTAELAADSMSARLDAVADTLDDLGFPADSFPQAAFAVSPRYDIQAGRELIGFDASVRLTLRTTNLVGVPELIGAALTMGATSVRSITFRSTQEDSGHAEALRLAYSRALNDAEVIAGAAGLQLGRIRLITTQPQTGGIQLRVAATELAGYVSPLAVQPEQVVARASITVHWELLTP